MNDVQTSPILIREGLQRRLSLRRLFLAILLLAGIIYGFTYAWQQLQETKAIRKPWFAAYVDATATPFYPFEQLGTTKNHNVVLSFIVSSPATACIPTWGGVYTLDQAKVEIDLDRRIARLRQLGGNAAISFGGQLHDELALNCKDDTKLLKAYQSVVNKYSIDTIDLDLEGNGLADKDAMKRRAIAIAKLQNDRRAQKKNLAVWLTLPVTPQGFSEDGTSAISQMLSSGVDLAGVNLMTMDCGQSLGKDESMEQASEKALTEAHRQLGILYNRAGINLNSKSLWAKIGATPMIGQNDIGDEIFTLNDAMGLSTFAVSRGIGRMSSWSVNRDIQCSDNYVDVKVVSDSCSGVKQDKLGFTLILAKDFEGEISQNAVVVTAEDHNTNIQESDDPQKSPYQIWKQTGAYLQGTKVVWHRNVYQAKWWTQGEMPDNPVLQSWQTPWQLVGPVLPGEKPVPQPTLPKGTYPEWQVIQNTMAASVYFFTMYPIKQNGGQRVTVLQLQQQTLITLRGFL